MRRVVITGMGAVTPIGNSVAELWESVQAGKCGIAPITHYDASARKAMDRLTSLGFGNMPVCMAKNQYSLSDDPKKLGRPKGFTVNIRDIYVSAGAGFVVAITGTVMTMPGLPLHPAAERIDVNDEGKITGLF